MQCDLKRPKTSVKRKFVRFDIDNSLCDSSTFYNDKDLNNGKVIPDNGQSDDTNDLGKPIPNPMPDDLDAPLQLKSLHKYHLGHHFGHCRGHYQNFNNVY